MANIDFRTIENLIEMPEFYHKRWYILSGTTGTEVNIIKENLRGIPFSLIKIEEGNFWFTLIGKEHRTLG